jgi:DNA-binding GntR family transcriptional regulator
MGAMSPSRQEPRGSARELTFKALRRGIVSLALAPATPLSENELAKEFGVSRTPVRESLILLREEGLVEVVPQVGTFVSQVDLDRVAEAQFIREAIECTALAGLTDTDASSPILQRLRTNLRQQREAQADGDGERFFALDEEFHRLLLELSGRQGAWSSVDAAKAHLDRARRLSLMGTRAIGDLVDQHLRVVEAIEHGAVASAVAALRTHLRTVFDDIERIRRESPELFSTGDRRSVRQAPATQPT